MDGWMVIKLGSSVDGGGLEISAQMVCWMAVLKNNWLVVARVASPWCGRLGDWMVELMER